MLARDLSDGLALTSLELGGLWGELSDAAGLARVAVEMRVPSMVVSAGDRKQQRMEQLVQELTRLLAELPAQMSIELANRCGSRLEQVADFHELFIRLDDPRLWVAVDVVESHRASVNPADAVNQLADRTSRLVVGDAVGDRRVPLGEGEANVSAAIGRVQGAAIVLDACVTGTGHVVVDLIRERQRLEAMFSIP